ncbi:MAG: hypothetical protein ACT4OD_00205 [Candidatus Nitrosotenuis sp.]
MGLSVSIGGAIVIFTIAYIVMMFPSLIDATTSLTNTSSLRTDLENSILKSDIRLTAVNGTSLSNIVYGGIQNTGTEKIWDYSKFNVIITYDGGIVTKTKYTEQLAYEKSCTNSIGKWCVVSITEDFQDPKILNTDERLVVKAVLSHPIYPNGLATVLVSTDNGVTAEKTNRAS